jgi:hypothetical protein
MTDLEEARSDTPTADDRTTDVHDLRSALELLKQHPGQYHETDQ